MQSSVATEVINFSFQIDYDASGIATLIDPAISSTGPLEQFTSTFGLNSQGYVGFFNGTGVDEIDVFDNLPLGMADPQPLAFTGAQFYQCNAACQQSFPGEQSLGFGTYFGTVQVSVTDPPVGVPEPGCFALLSLGLLGLVALKLKAA